MRLHELYKCEHCPEFHPVEFDSCVKLWTKNFVVDLAERESVLGKVCWGIKLQRILQTSGPAELISQYFLEFDGILANLRNSIGQADLFHGLSADVHAVYCIKANKNVCIRKWSGCIQYSEHVELFTREPSRQWMEITDFRVHVKPLWFAKNRVYQFPTYLIRDETDNFSRRFYCKIMVDTNLVNIMTIDLDADAHRLVNWILIFQMINVMENQKKSKNQKSAFTSEHIISISEPFTLYLSGLRLRFYANSKQPRAWIRFPVVTHKDIPASTTIDLAPVYSSNISTQLICQCKN